MKQKTKIFAVSDIHGCATLLKDALQNAGYDREREDHLLLVLGDCFDRGSENLEVLKFLERIERKVCIFGNHEEILLKILKRGTFSVWDVTNGTMDTVAEFFGKRAVDSTMGTVDFSGRCGMLRRLDEFFSSFVNYFESEHYLFCHGFLPTVRRADGLHVSEHFRSAGEELWKEARWTRFCDVMDEFVAYPGKQVVCGHVPLPSLGGVQKEILVTDSIIAIDTGAVFTGRLSVLVLEDELL